MPILLDADTGATGGRGSPNAWSPSSNSTNWAKIAGTSPTISQASSMLHLTGISAATVYELGSGTAADAEAVIRFKCSSTSDVFAIFLRETATNNYYYAQASLATQNLKLNKNILGTLTQLGSSFSFTMAAATLYWIRFRVIGTSLYARIWADGNSEPSTWGVTVTGDSSITGAGGWGVRISPNAVGDTVDFDSYTVNKSFTLGTMTEEKYYTQFKSLAGIARNTFYSKFASTKSQGEAKFYGRVSLVGLGREKFYTKSPLLSIARETFKTAFVLKSLTRNTFFTKFTGVKGLGRSTFYGKSVLSAIGRDRFYTASVLKSLGRSTFRTRMLGLVSKGRATFQDRVSLAGTTRARFLTAKSLSTTLRDTFKNSNSVVAQWFGLRLSSIKNLITLLFTDQHPLALKFGESPVAQPNSSVQVQVQAMNASNQAISNLVSLTCVVTYPDGSTSSTYSLGSGITNSGGGIYTLIYTTKMQGINSELWTATDVAGDTTQYLNKTAVTY